MKSNAHLSLFQLLNCMLAFFLVGCFSDARVSKLNDQGRPPFEGRVFITALPLPHPSEFVPLGDVAVDGDLTESRDAVLNRMADIARNLGANAVVEVKDWRTRTIGTNHHARGRAVIVNNRSLAILNGEWR